MSLKDKQKNIAKLKRQQALAWLAQRFPEAFDNQYRVRPLKIGIMADLMTYAEEARAVGISKTKLREAIALFTRRIEYLTCLKLKETRINLFGEPCEPVSSEDAEQAFLKIRKRIEKTSKHIPTSVQSRATLPAHPSDFKRPLSTRTTPSITIKRKVTAPLTPTMTKQLREKLDLENA